MYQWNIFYKNAIENKSKNFKVKANSKQEAIQKAILKVYKLFNINDRLLNNYNIELIRC